MSEASEVKEVGATIRVIALSAIMIATTAALTMFVSIPFPATRGYFNLGDAMVMLAGLLLGARLGGIAGGVGSAIADVLLGFGYFAPITLIVKGLEGFLVGAIGHGRKFPFKVLGVVIGAIEMLAGYFSFETVMFGVGPAITELVSINWLQVVFGAIISLALVGAIIKGYPAASTWAVHRAGVKEIVAAVVGVAVIMAIVVAVYLGLGIQL